MRFNYVPRHRRGWQRWFAWFPVRVNGADIDWPGEQVVWWEWVERQPDSYAGGISGYQYRLPARASDSREDT